MRAKNKLEVYKNFEMDIWGHIFLFDKRLLRSIFWKKVNFFLMFFFRLKILRPWKRFRFFYIYNYGKSADIVKKEGVNNDFNFYLKWKFRDNFYKNLSKLFKYSKYKRKVKFVKNVSLLLRSYYVYLNKSDFLKIGKKVLNKEGFFEVWYILFLECRVVSILYRLNILMNIFLLKSFVISGNVIINNKVVDFINYKLRVGDIVKFKKPNDLLLKMQLYKRLKEKRFFFLRPRFVIFNYLYMVFIIWDFPKENDLAFPISIDIFKGLLYN